MAQWVKNPPVNAGYAFQSLGWEDPLEEGTATHFSILARRIPRAEEPGELTVHWLAESDTTERLNCLCRLSHYVTSNSFVTPLDCGPPGSSVHGILQARILEWIATFSSRGSS